MSYSNLAYHTARFVKRPEGFTNYRGGGCPVTGNTYVETLHETDEGFAIGPVMKALAPRLLWWKDKKPKSGALVGWRPAEPPQFAPAGAEAADDPA